MTLSSGIRPCVTSCGAIPGSGWRQEHLWSCQLPSIVGEVASSGPDTSLPGRTQDLIYLSLITPQCRFTSSSQLQAITHPSHD